VQDAAAKHRLIGDKAAWHLIGHLQTNKAKDAVKIFDLIHSVDSVHLAQEIDKQAGKLGKVQDILIQVNTSGEESKFGIAPEAAIDLLKAIVIYPNIKIKGFMTIAPEVEDPQTVRPYFRALRELRDKIDSSWSLSMGMTNDFEIAIEEGATMVRIGRAIFK
jgi:PLP dependent protein